LISSYSVWKNTIWRNHATSGHQYWSWRGAGGGKALSAWRFL